MFFSFYSFQFGNSRENIFLLCHSLFIHNNNNIIIISRWLQKLHKINDPKHTTNTHSHILANSKSAILLILFFKFFSFVALYFRLLKEFLLYGCDSICDVSCAISHSFNNNLILVVDSVRWSVGRSVGWFNKTFGRMVKK